MIIKFGKHQITAMKKKQRIPHIDQNEPLQIIRRWTIIRNLFS